MTASIEIDVMNGLLFLHDPAVDNIPEVTRAGSCWSNSDCVAFSCQNECFGPTKLSVGPSAEINPARELVFDGILRTPSREIVVDTVLSEVVLKHRVQTNSTRVRIWTLGARESEIVIIGLG
ncbi:hypothetical protein PQJ75_24370 [Rhodoplanes sp. TEM]|uniref:Uncharacterized protein n=1 Tax=Rhodoplanes tepidamans TaxID=200616 RepID=A0ABT5JDL1_RHOTP|nr:MULTISPECIES: hypothetical protein [Rhodoplanes]MDC7787598.1 hypothetical protein [Rhodoplanes tepidamans]MDC7986877.1 hypothetical protein [Rhodoplanes sp. TEM]MDQ0358026.1 hypothetical protein [Rhodoplanes tepidamans]